MSGSTNPTYCPTLQKSSLRLRRVYEARVTTGCTHCGAIFADARSAFRNWSAGYRDSSDNSTLRGFPRAHRTQVYIHIVKAVRIKPACRHCRPHSARAHERSEEHTSELQSLMRISYAVLCLKKKTNNKNI